MINIYFMYGALWHTIGVCGFIFWYIKEYDLLAIDMLLAVIVGVLGPIAWILGYFIHGRPTSSAKPKILIKKRT